MLKKKLHIRNYVALSFCVAVIITTLSCRKNIAGVAPSNPDSAMTMSQVFEDYWNGMNNNYVFWDIDTTNWNNIYNKYQPLFTKLDINNKQDVLTAYGYFQAMTSGLTDCHYRINFFNPFLKDSSVNPARTRKKAFLAQSLTNTRRFFDSVVLNNYLDKNSGFADTGSFSGTSAGKGFTSTLQIVTGTINQHTVYLHLNEFYLQALMDNTRIAAVWNHFVSYLHAPGLEGVIIDMRSNSGGNLADLDFICGQMIDHTLPFAFTKEKNGNGRLDYTPWANAVVTPEPGSSAVTRPIVVLTDRNSISMAEMTTMALRQLPNTYVIGDTTWGANGPLSTSIGVLGGGQFNFGHFGYVYTSSAQYKYIDGKIYEHAGFPPDRYMPYNKDSILAGIDIQLKAAIHRIDSLK